MRTVHQRLRHHIVRHKNSYLGLTSVLGCCVLVLAIFFATRGADPHTSELAFIEHSAGNAGSVLPASCSSDPGAGADFVGYIYWYYYIVGTKPKYNHSTLECDYTFSADSYTINRGESTTLTTYMLLGEPNRNQYVKSCTINGSYAYGPVSYVDPYRDWRVPVTFQTSVAPTQTTTYTLDCVIMNVIAPTEPWYDENNGVYVGGSPGSESPETHSKQLTVTVNAPPPPSATLNGNPQTVAYSQGSSLTITPSAGIQYCNISSGYYAPYWGGTTIVEGGPTISASVYPTVSTTYYLACHDGYTWAMSTFTVYVEPPPVITELYTTQNPIPYGASPSAVFNSTNTMYCRIALDWVTWTEGYYSTNSFTLPQSITTAPGSHLLNLHCWNSAWYPTGWSTISFTVDPPPTASISISPNPVPYGGSPTFTLTSTNTIYCHIRNSAPDTGVDWYGWGVDGVTSGSYSPGPQTIVGQRYAWAYCYNPTWQAANATGWVSFPYTVDPPATSNVLVNGSNIPITVPYGSNPTFTLQSTNALYCHVRHIDPNGTWDMAVDGPTSGNFNPGSLTIPGTHYAASYCYGSGWSHPTPDQWTYKSFNVAPAGVNGVCAATHYTCSVGTPSGGAEASPNWTWICNGSGGGSNASCSEPIPSPTGYSASCSVAGTTASGSWTLPSGVPYSYVRVYDDTAGSYSYMVPELNSDTGPSFSFASVPGHNYTSWVHSRLPSGAYSSQVYSYFTCPNPLPDLTAGAISPTSATAGVPVTLSGIASNIGGASTGASFPNYLIVRNAPNGNGTDIYAPNVTIGALASGASGTVTGPAFAFPSAGTYSAILCTDQSGTNPWVSSIPESNEGNNCGPWTNITVSPAPVNGACAATHYSCTAGTSVNNVSGSGVWTWGCNGTGGGSNASCSQPKPTPTGTLTVPASCVIASGASTCTVTASWSTSNTESPAVVDENVGATLSTAANSSGFTVWVAYTQTTFRLKDGSIVLDTDTVTASCAPGTSFDGDMNSCQPPPVNGSCAATHYNCAAGTSVNNVSGTGVWTWGCNGTGGGANVSCSETMGPPDLIAGDVTPSPASGVVGQSESFTAQVTNIGAGSAANFPNIFQIADSTVTNTIAMVAANTVASLVPSASTGISGAYTFSTPESYRVRACSNFNTSWGGSISESNGSNNCGNWVELIVACPAGQAYAGGVCTSCSNGGCSGPGGSPSDPDGSLVCNNGSTPPPSCPVPPPTATLSAVPTTINQGYSSVLSWNSTGATSCVGTGFTAGGPSGSRSTGTLSTPGTQNYQVVCTGASGTSPPAFASVVVLAPGASISAVPERVGVGQSTTLTWSANGVTSCIITGPSGTIASGTADVSNNFSTGSPRSVVIGGKETYTITCQTAGAPVSDSVTINVQPDFDEF